MRQADALILEMLSTGQWRVLAHQMYASKQHNAQPMAAVTCTGRPTLAGTLGRVVFVRCFQSLGPVYLLQAHEAGDEAVAGPGLLQALLQSLDVSRQEVVQGLCVAHLLRSQPKLKQNVLTDLVHFCQIMAKGHSNSCCNFWLGVVGLEYLVV